MYFKNVLWTPDDPILGLLDVFKQDQRKDKINLIVGVYRDELGNTPILEAVKLAEHHIVKNESTKTYIGIAGSPEFCDNTKKLILGENHFLIKNECIQSIQTPGGSGALRLAADFFYIKNPSTKIHLSNPTWENHDNVFTKAGLKIGYYPYYDAVNKGIRFDELIDYLNNVSSNDVVLFHTCCHNPTGYDFNEKQWKIITEKATERGFLVLFDFAYQGMGNSFETDSLPIKIYAEKNPNFMITYSCSKNFGIYNERTGALLVAAEKSEQAKNVLSQLKLCARGNYSNPPSHGASIVNTILANPELKIKWSLELNSMCQRIKQCRELFLDAIKKYAPEKDFSFIGRQKGMFSYSSLTKEQVMELRDKHGIYMLLSGRMNVASINSKNIDRIASSIAMAAQRTN